MTARPDVPDTPDRTDARQESDVDLTTIEQAAQAIPPHMRAWTQMQEQDGEVLPDGTGYVGDYEPSCEVAIGEPDADGRVGGYFALPTVAMSRFAAAADPQTVLALVGEVHRLRRELADANLVIRLDESGHCGGTGRNS